MRMIIVISSRARARARKKQSLFVPMEISVETKSRPKDRPDFISKLRIETKQGGFCPTGGFYSPTYIICKSLILLWQKVGTRLACPYKHNRGGFKMSMSTSECRVRCCESCHESMEYCAKLIFMTEDVSDILGVPCREAERFLAVNKKHIEQAMRDAGWKAIKELKEEV